nr:uncharacterized protein LOC111509632 [Leptinotarsa decemlineata]XP_023021180.1 uncharacterized protein LOC111509632 [Leptinotarsa decemlineata]
MAEEEYRRKMESLQQYIPFLDNMIIQLRDPSKKNREQQLSKMESLHAMITDRKKKLKLETLNKCEDVISKLYLKVNHKPLTIVRKEKAPSPRSTPASPSPPRDIRNVFDIKPLPIPTERLEPMSHIPKIDIYSSAAESLTKSKPKNNSPLSIKCPDMSKPPISLDDLKDLEEDVQEKINEGASLSELNNMRDKLAHQILMEQVKSISPSSTRKASDINTTVKNNLSLSKKMDEEKRDDTSPKQFSPYQAPEVDSPKKSIQLNLKPKPSSKVTIEPDSIFGKIISTIDEKIMEDKKKAERRSSLARDEKVKAEDKSSSGESKKKDSKSKDESRKTEDKPTSSSSSKSEKSKDKKYEKKSKGEAQKSKTDTKESKNKDEKKKVDKHRESTSSKDERENSDKDAHNGVIVIEDEPINNTNEQSKSEASSSETVEKPDLYKDPKMEVIKNHISNQIEELKEKNEAISKGMSPIYKRLADKYHPKPRKPIVDPDIDQAVTDSIEANMKKSPPKPPILNRLADVPPPPASLVKCSQLEPEIPTALQKIMNPCTTQLINTVVSQFIHTSTEPERLIPPMQPLMLPVHTQQMMTNQPLPQIPQLLGNTPLIPNKPLLPTPSRLMSPNENFISDYAREDFCMSSNSGRSDIRFDPPANRFIPPLITPQRFNQSYSNYNQMDTMHKLDYYPPNAPLPANQYNGGPPLLSPETPHYQEHKQNSFGMPFRDFKQQDDFRWRMDRRDFEPMHRGPKTYREFREMRENSRDPRVVRDHRDYRDNRVLVDRDTRDSRESRDNREYKDNRDNREPRDSRESKDPRLIRGDPRLNREFDRGRSRVREDYRPNRFDSKFDRMYTRTNRNRSRSRSNSRSRTNNDSDSFMSPLDSLYSGKEEHKTGKGYGKQSFRIPKIKKESEPLRVEPTSEVLMVQDDSETDKDDKAPQAVEGNDQESDDGGADTGHCEAKDDTDEEAMEDANNIASSSEPEKVRQVDDIEIKHRKVVAEKDAEITSKDVIQDEKLSGPPELTKKAQEKSLDDATNSVPAVQTETEKQDIVQEAAKSPEHKLQETKPPAEQTILAQFFANLLGSQNKKEKKTALYSLISTFSDSFNPKELSKIKKIIKAEEEDSSEDEDGQKKASPEAESKKTEESAGEVSEVKQSAKQPLEVTKVAEPVDNIPGTDAAPEDAIPEDVAPKNEIVPKRKLRRRVKRISSESPKDSANRDKDEEDSPPTETMSSEFPDDSADRGKDEEDLPPAETMSSEITTTDLDRSLIQGDVVVTVGERIKSRKRTTTCSIKPRKKCRSELDKLHEDIQDMFIRDGVLTATGKRMCHLLKDDPHALSVPSSGESEEPLKVRKKPGPKPKVKTSDHTEVNTMKNVRVIISKIPESEIQDNEKYSRRLTRSMTYEDSDNENSVIEEDSRKEASDFENDSGSESSEYEKEPSLTNETKQNAKLRKKLKRKRGGWASGVIKKNKKKKPVPEDVAKPTVEEELNDSSSKDFLEPDKEYFVDFAMQSSYACKLCDFKGKFITTHYKTVHPDSEVLSSRFTPAVAAESIADSKKNLSKYEACAAMRGAKKVKFVCRFCTANTVVFPTLFYDHLSTHTGEYRHICPNCGICFCGAKTLKYHMNTVHKEDAMPIVRKSYNSTIMFGYICSECNYVQMNEKLVQEHVNIYHLIRPNIYKINLSTHFDEEIEKLQKYSETPELMFKEAEPSEKASEAVMAKGKEKTIAAKAKEVVEDVMEEPEPEMAPPKRRKPGPKPGPKSKKKLLERRYLRSKENESEDTSTTTDSESVSSRSSDKDVEKSTRIRCDLKLDAEKILPGKSKRAAKAKAQEKLKVIMELTDNADKKKSSSDEAKGGDTTESSEGTPQKEQKEVSEQSGDTPILAEPLNIKQVEKIEKVVKKEIEMNVFTCKTDLQEENKKIEQERLQKMDELNRSVGSRTSLNFVDKLCNRLSKNDVMVKEEPKDELTDSMCYRGRSNSPISMPVLEKNPPIVRPPTEPSIAPPPVPTQTKMKNPVLPEEEDPLLPTPSFDVTQKNDRVIVDMIEKLRGKLGTAGNLPAVTVEDDDDDGPPPLTHVNELVNVKPSDSSTKTLQIGGLVKVIKTSESTTFCCLVPPCVFSTDHKDVFQRHCREMHGASAVGRNTTLCETCGVQIEATQEASLLENLFKHTITEHADFLNTTQPGSDSVEQPTPVRPLNLLRIRRLSGDALSVTKNDWEEEIDKDQKNSNVSESPENKETIDETVAEEAQATVAQIELTDDNPFPFKIADVMSLAEPQPPPLAPIVKQNLNLVVKEAKLSVAEIGKPRKTQKAMAKFIEEAGNLYKCPHYYCLFTTNFRDFLERHLKAHSMDPESMIPCVYCDMKTPWEHVPMHIDIRHGNCRFSCSYCLYRAAVKEYVFLHQDRAHPYADYSVIALPNSKSIKKFALAETKVDPMTLCEPYKCTSFCLMEFLFENEFRKHLMDSHSTSTFVTCGYQTCRSRVMASKMTQHWSMAHQVSLYQCGYCKTSCSDIKLMFHHFSKVHQNVAPEILVRMVTPMPDKITLGYSAEAFRRLRKVVSMPKNITSEDKSEKPSSPVGKLVVKQPPAQFSNTVSMQVMNTVAPPSIQKAIVLPTSKNSVATYSLVASTAPITTGVNSLILVTSNPNSLMKSSQVNMTSPVATVSKAHEDPTTPSPLQLPLLSTPPSTIPFSSTPASSPLPSPAIPTTPVTDKSISTVLSGESNSTPTHSNVAPLEHITLGEDNNQEEVSKADVDPLDLGEAGTSQNDIFSSDEESDSLLRSEKVNKESEVSIEVRITDR